MCNDREHLYNLINYTEFDRILLPLNQPRLIKNPDQVHYSNQHHYQLAINGTDDTTDSKNYIIYVLNYATIPTYVLKREGMNMTFILNGLRDMKLKRCYQRQLKRKRIGCYRCGVVTNEYNNTILL